jgi:lipopolysaccharide/colanic/teichoic acid biosynthesis glycosyltransferase
VSRDRGNHERVYARRVKPAADRVGGVLLLAAFSPVMGAVAVAVRTSLGSPVIYRQIRVGRGGVPFTMLKFRTMTPDRRVATLPFDGPERRVSWEATSDARHTPLGALLRRASLDELPQLWNVVRGDMSLVGPRPEVPAAVATYADRAAERHLVRPGVTGLWQVTARGTMPMELCVDIDLDYVRRVSARLDAWILLRTVPELIRSARRPAEAPLASGGGSQPGRVSRFVDRPHPSYGRTQWVVRLGVRNVQWIRAEGVGRLVEEHDLRPVHHSVAAVRRARWRRANPVEPGGAVPVFVAGVPRSGTNMIVRGLGSLPEFETYNEGNRVAFDRYRLRPQPAIRGLVMRSRQRFVLFKPLLDSHAVPGLMDGLQTPMSPRAIWAYRDVDGRVRSALSKFGANALEAMRATAQGEADGSWQAQGLSQQSLELIRSTDWDAASAADAAALLWLVKNRMFFEAGLDRRDDVLPVSYGALVRDPGGTMRAVCQFLEVPWRPSTSSHIDRRSAAGRPAVALDPRIRGLCDDMMEQLDAAVAERVGTSA